jgi:recombination protein RecA
MPKKKKEKEESKDFFANLAEHTGGRILKGLGDSRYFVDSGNLALNYINSGRFMGGGWPTGITEVYGPPASAKSLLAYAALGACQRMGGVAILLDCERAANEKFAVSAGHVNENELIIQTPLFIEDVERKIYNMTKYIRTEMGDDIPIFFAWDSIGVASCEREYKETNLPDKYTQEQFKKIVGGKEQPGERAKAAGRLLRKINPFLDEYNASLFVINQTRMTIGQMWGDPEVTAGGGKALPFYANCRVRTSPMKKIEDKAKKIPIGVNLRLRNKKSRSFVPFLGTSNVQLYFASGINPLGGLLEVLIGAGRVAGKGTYTVQEPWAGGEEIKFKASMARNDVPIELILQCPALVDAESTKEIEDYLAIYSEAYKLSMSDDVVETIVEGEDDIYSDDEEDILEIS